MRMTRTSSPSRGWASEVVSCALVSATRRRATLRLETARLDTLEWGEVKLPDLTIPRRRGLAGNMREQKGQGRPRRLVHGSRAQVASQFLHRQRVMREVAADGGKVRHVLGDDHRADTAGGADDQEVVLETLAPQ